MVLLSSLFSAIIMWVAIWLLTRRTGSLNLKPVLMISVATCILTLFALRFLGPWGIGLVMAALIYALIEWCFLPWTKAIPVALVWLLSQIAFGWFISPIF